MDTKNDLREYLSKKLQRVLNVNFVVFFGTSTLHNMASSDPNLLTYNQEEANTRTILHVLDLCRSDPLSEFVVSCSYTVVLLLLLNYFDYLNSCTIFKTSHHVYHLEKVFENLNPKVVKSLLRFHTFTGCDQTGKLHGFRKKVCSETLISASDDILEAFDRLGELS